MFVSSACSWRRCVGRKEVTGEFKLFKNASFSGDFDMVLERSINL